MQSPQRFAADKHFKYVSCSSSITDRNCVSKSSNTMVILGDFCEFSFYSIDFWCKYSGLGSQVYNVLSVLVKLNILIV